MRINLYDILAVLGVIILSAGVAMFSIALGMIVAGIALIVIAFVGAASQAVATKPEVKK